ncbi:MAG: VCBS repeat-containing protein, partial [Planctomycetes bacterium]|nr:VCBS repeat-containing protein [Planctomycetota bacterium]
DGDGDDDLFFCCKAGPRVFLTDQSEGGLSWTPASGGLPKTSIGNITRACLPVDLDGDGKPELITGELTDPQMPKEQRLTAAVYSFNPESSGWSLVDSGLPSQLSVTDAASADMDGDGHADIVLASIQEGVVVYKGDGALRFTLAGQIASAPNPRIALGDANGDGLVDICMLHGATKSIPDGGGVQVFLNSDDAWTER